MKTELVILRSLKTFCCSLELMFINLKWVVTVRTYDLELKTFSMKPSAEELENFLLKELSRCTITE